MSFNEWKRKHYPNSPQDWLIDMIRFVEWQIAEKTNDATN